MAEIFRKLKGLEFQWKIITPYFIRCKSVKQPMCTFIVTVHCYLNNCNRHDLYTLMKCEQQNLEVLFCDCVVHHTISTSFAVSQCNHY